MPQAEPQEANEERPDAGRPAPRESKIAPHKSLLGERPDEEIAKLAGVSTKYVVRYRRQLGIPGWKAAGKSSRPWTAKPKPKQSAILPFLELLGQLSDREIARRAGVTAGSVRDYRRARKIPGFRPPPVPRPEPEPEPQPEPQPRWAVNARRLEPPGPEEALELQAPDLCEALVVAKETLASRGGRWRILTIRRIAR